MSFVALMQQRYYDPGIGRFLSVDPVTADGNTGGNFNRYKYAANNPYKFTDPDGRQEYAAEKFSDSYGSWTAEERAPFEAVAVPVTTAIVAMTPVVGPELALGLRVTTREVAQEATKEGKAPLMGRNPKDGGSRTNTDAGPGGNRATAKSIFRNQSEGKKTTTPMSNGGARTRAENGVQVRHNPDGSSRVDMPNRGSAPNGESLHTPPPPPPPSRL